MDKLKPKFGKGDKVTIRKLNKLGIRHKARIDRIVLKKLGLYEKYLYGVTVGNNIDIVGMVDLSEKDLEIQCQDE